jgi:hypothetical protein
MPASPAPVAAFPAYDLSAFELDPTGTAREEPWSADAIAAELRRRAAEESARRELRVNYYRIGHPLAYALPVARRPRPAELPVGISWLQYPWLIWLTWALEERWLVWHAAWRQGGDEEAGRRLQEELAELRGWDRIVEIDDQVGLVTGHIAGVLAVALADPTGWDEVRWAEVERVADDLLERDIAPWLPERWPAGEALTPERLHNIPVIALVRAAQLARVRGHGLGAELDARAQEVLAAWGRARLGAGRHTEGPSYDGYLMDSLTAWLDGHPRRERLLDASTRQALGTLVEQWIGLGLPGRPDLHVPLGDTEAEMPFWVTPLARIARWLGREDAMAVLARASLRRVPAAALAEAWHHPVAVGLARPEVGAWREVTHAWVRRSGWEVEHHSVTVSAPRSPMGHLHADGGHLILAWQGRAWVTDPGYQQYLPGEERDYTLGWAAHNAPVIAGRPQVRPMSRLLSAPTTDERVELDLTGGYEDLPTTARVTREVRVVPGARPHVVVCDRFEGLTPGVVITWHWLGGAHLTWAFAEGWARLSDGQHALWLGQEGGALDPRRLVRHPGSRGPLSLGHDVVLPEGRGEVRWWWRGDGAGSWTTPG